MYLYIYIYHMYTYCPFIMIRANSLIHIVGIHYTTCTIIYIYIYICGCVQYMLYTYSASKFMCVLHVFFKCSTCIIYLLVKLHKNQWKDPPFSTGKLTNFLWPWLQQLCNGLHMYFIDYMCYRPQLYYMYFKYMIYIYIYNMYIFYHMIYIIQYFICNTIYDI